MIAKFRLPLILLAGLLGLMLVLGGCAQGETTLGTPVDPTDTPALIEPDKVEEPETGAPADSVETANQLAPPGTPRENYYAPFPLTITLDGDLSDWNGVPRVTLPENAESITGVTSINFAAAADEQYLYLLADVNDSKIISGEHGADYWNEDSVEFYFNATGNLTLGSYQDGVAQVTVPALNIGRNLDEVILAGVRGETVEAQVKVVATDGGYAIEMAVPLQNRVWNIPVFHGSVIGFQVHLNGASESSRNTKLIWSARDTSDTSYQTPRVFGELIFFEIGKDQTARVAPEGPPAPVLIPVAEDALYKQADASISDRVEDLLAHMTLAEKIGQMTLVEKNSIINEDITQMFIGGLLSGGGGYPANNTPQGWATMVDDFQRYALDSHLGIPLIYGVDAVHGHNNVIGAVIFPHNIGLGAANDLELMERIGAVTAIEMAATGIYWNYAPGVMVPQDIRWGRTYEGYSENPERVSDLAAAYLRGMQAEPLLGSNLAIGTPKHYVGDGGTAWGSSTNGSYQIDQGVTEIDEATLRAIHLPPYPAVIEAGARSIMVSYSSWGGMKMHAQHYLITEVLKGELGFTGFVVSDWGGVDQIDGNFYKSVVAAINAGIDMNMVPYQYLRFMDTLIEAVEAGDVPLERIDDAVRRILTVKFEMGLFEQPYSQVELLKLVGSDAHRAVAREAVRKSLVLLKNEGNLLPLSKEMPALYVGGAAANDIGIQSGGWTIEWQGKKGAITPGTTILEAIQNTLSAESVLEYDEYGRFENLPAEGEIVCLAVVGENPYAEGQGDSRSLGLSTGDVRLLGRMREQCTQLAVILISGRPLVMTEFIASSEAFVAAWLPGTEGQGVADVLFGDYPFSGTLPYTWPASIDQVPLGAGTGEPLYAYDERWQE